MKVDRVASLAEATTLESIGAGMIGVEIAPNPRFADSRTVTVDQAAQIRQMLRNSTLTVSMDLGTDPDHVVRLALRSGADFVQPLTSGIPPHPVRVALRDAGIGIVYAGVEISHDDDPGWIFSAHDGTPDLNAAFFQVEVLPEYRDSWAFLRDRSPEFEEEFQIEDLDELGGSHPLIAGLDLGPGNVGQIATSLPRVRGLSLTLAERTERTDVHFHSFSEATAALEAASPDGLRAFGRTAR
ncbi:hypothetical protein AB0F81_15685 [Actinoplanes sp. NPDC024001]|uniref:hypothetical protein n=1 Tax=Actinoplanes sp. NPDC024001 TaxID=3154598 RepID=UPI0033D986E5